MAFVVSANAVELTYRIKFPDNSFKDFIATPGKVVLPLNGKAWTCQMDVTRVSKGNGWMLMCVRGHDTEIVGVNEGSICSQIERTGTGELAEQITTLVRDQATFFPD